MRVLIGATAQVMLAGCLDQDNSRAAVNSAIEHVESVPTVADSPEATVKSWWALKDASIPLDRAICAEYMKMNSALTEKLSSLASEHLPKRLDCSAEVISFERKIVKVEVEPDTKAVVTALIKNSAPPEPGAEFNDDDRRIKEAGDRYRYTLERKGKDDNWRISQVENIPSYAKDWEVSYKAPKPSNNIYVYEQFQ